ncbi:TetR/AcrR family transcriptional regulator [Cytobacillus purgationiresistens]|uniref:AcrR family transcriptional regulator n=1 Tax=Cytobacillus purgationiresistens TaxID=863449 RepID=A0ABU0AQQ5_9BACI|nr:TetR/AcrR family transcriptional regulator [Cytobacillus purgationiresistens]MDQ0273626.1 AcrR family transcriptional regulator [Cytobacillus purgationiresistens]
MSAELIRDAALIHFAKDGYEGASLSKIAKDVGIKKPSIYAHYKGKDELFIAVVKYVLDTEKRRMFSYFLSQKENPLENRLKGFFTWMAEENRENEHAKFLLRISYFPPSKLNREVMDFVNPFFHQMQRLLARVLKNQLTNDSNRSDDFMDEALAYITIVDGSVIELMFNGEEYFLKRFSATWPIFWRGLLTTGKGADEK